MAATYRSISTGTSGTSSTDVVVTKPAGLAVGDMLVAFITSALTPGTYTAPSGWEEIENGEEGTGADTYMDVFAKIATSADVAASDFTFTSSIATNSKICQCVAVSLGHGVSIEKNLKSIIDVSVSYSDPTSTFDTAITPNITNSLLLMCVANGGDGDINYSDYAITNNNPSWTEAADSYAEAAGDGVNCAVAYGTYGASTTTGNFSVNGYSAIGVLVAINDIVTYESKTSTELSLHATPQNLTLPSGTTVGDLLVLFYSAGGNSSAGGHFHITASGTVADIYDTNNAKYADAGITGAAFRGLHTIYPDATDVSNGYIQIYDSDTYGLNGTFDLYRVSGATASGAIAYNNYGGSGTATPTFVNTVTPVSPLGIVFMLVASACESFTRTASGYAVTTDNPTWTEITDTTTHSGHDDGIHTAWAVRDGLNATGDSFITFSDTVDDCECIVLYINDPTSVITHPTVLSATFAVQDPTITGGALVSPTVAEATFTVQDPTVTNPSPKWVNDDKPSAPTWVNETKP